MELLKGHEKSAHLHIDMELLICGVEVWGSGGGGGRNRVEWRGKCGSSFAYCCVVSRAAT